jgi:hypothetical protein
VLLLAAAAIPEKGLPWMTAALCPTSLLILWSVLHANAGFAPQPYFAATDALATRCRPGDVVASPPDLGLLIAGLTPCSVAVGHRVLTPAFQERVSEAARFADEATAPGWRRAYLEQVGARFVVLPAGRGEWLGPAPPFARLLATPLLEVWERRPIG